MAPIMGTFRDDNLTGTKDDDRIYGLRGNDTLSGGLGYDTLIGGAGADTFVLTNNAILQDYKQGEDDILFHSPPPDPPPEDSKGPSNPPDKFIDFIYNSRTGALSYVIDGTGKAKPLEIATLPTDLALTNKDISIIDSTASDSSPLIDLSVINQTTLGY